MATAPLLPSHQTAYATANPFPHTVIDDFFEPSRIKDAAAEVRSAIADPDAPFYGQAGKAGIRDRSAIGSATRALIDEMNSERFVRWLENLTGIDNLHADPALMGGGVHQIRPGGFLKVHTDFNWHEGMQLHRRVNVLLYLNEVWREEWGGNLELWKPDMSAMAVSIAPLLNRLVVFSTNDDSYHGHPEPLACPTGVTRNSIALYYYSATPAPCRSFGRSKLTNYRERPGERFGSLRHAAHLALLQLPLARHLLGR